MGIQCAGGELEKHFFELSFGVGVFRTRVQYVGREPIGELGQHLAVEPFLSAEVMDERLLGEIEFFGNGGKTRPIEALFGKLAFRRLQEGSVGVDGLGIRNLGLPWVDNLPCGK